MSVTRKITRHGCMPERGQRCNTPGFSGPEIYPKCLRQCDAFSVACLDAGVFSYTRTCTPGLIDLGFFCVGRQVKDG